MPTSSKENGSPTARRSKRKVKPTKRGIPRLASGGGSSTRTENLKQPPKMANPPSAHFRSTEEISKKTAQNSATNAASVVLKHVEVVVKNKPRATSPSARERALAAAQDRMRRRKLGQEKGVELGAGDEDDLDPAKDLDGRAVKWQKQLELHLIPRVPDKEKKPTKSSLKPIRRRLDSLGNVVDDDVPLVLDNVEPVTVKRIVYQNDL